MKLFGRKKKGSVTEHQGDLFAAEGLDALGHGCNCKGVMGAGIAVQFKKRYPNMFQKYRTMCDAGTMLPGDVMPWRTMDGRPVRFVYNLMSQKNPGADARIEWLQLSVRHMLEHAALVGVQTIGLPQIGCGIGGLKWPDVKKVLEQEVKGTGIDIHVYSL